MKAGTGNSEQGMSACGTVDFVVMRTMAECFIPCSLFPVPGSKGAKA